MNSPPNSTLKEDKNSNQTLTYKIIHTQMQTLMLWTIILGFDWMEHFLT